MRRATLLLLLLPAAGCGPTCPTAHEWRADLRPDLLAGGQRLVLDANVIAQSNERPPLLLVRIEGQSPRPLGMVVLGADGKTALTLDTNPKQDGSYRLELSLPGGHPLPVGVYRLHTELPEIVEASFEVRHCVVYY